MPQTTPIAREIESLTDQGVDRELVIEAVKEAVRAAAKKHFSGGEEIQVDWTPETGLELSAAKVVVENVENPATEVSVDEARELGGEEIEVGDALLLPMPMEDLGRIAAQTAKQILFQKVRDAVRANVYDQYIDRVGELVNGFVKRFERGNMIIDLGNLEAILPRAQQTHGEQWNQGERIRVVISGVSKESRGPQVEVSRTSPALLERLFEMEVPEIYQGTVVIKSCVREPGERAKIAVVSTGGDIDPVAACVGMRGSRVQAIISELRGEKVDVIAWSEDPVVFVGNSLAPAKVNHVRISDIENRQMEVIVDEDQLSLAIGKRGCNVLLASNLTGWNIDLRTTEELNSGTLESPSAEELWSDKIIQPALSEITFAVSEQLTPSYFEKAVLPYLKAISDMQDIIDTIKEKKTSGVVVRSVTQSSPIGVSLEGASEAIQLIKESVVPWRRKHAQRMSSLVEMEKEADIANRRAEILERRARATKDRADAERITAEAKKQREETERLRLENEKLRIKLERAKIQLALDLLNQISPNLPEGERIAYAIKLLPALGLVTTSELEISVSS